MKIINYSVLLVFFLALAMQVSGLDLDLDQSSFRIGEQINFYSCEDLTFSCLDTFEKEEVQNGCAYYGINVADFTCSNPSIIGDNSSYDISVDDFESDLGKYLTRPSGDALYIARQVYAKSLLGESFDEYLLALRDMRREEEKCFGSDSCDLELTTGVLRYLSMAGVDRSNRVYHDGLLWLESRQNKDLYEDWLFSISASEGAECTLNDDDSVVESFTLNSSSETFIRDYSASEMESTCNRKHCLSVYDYFGDRVFNNCISAESTIKFEIESGCWYDDNRLSCSNFNTGRALTLNHLNEDNYDLGLDWTENNIAKVPIRADAIQNSRDILGNLFFYEATGLDRLKTWLWYSQNNDGSFGRQDKVYTTLEAARVFDEFSEEEWMDDAFDYLINYRSENEWSGLREESLGFDIFSTIEPPIVSKDLIYTSNNGEVNFEFQSDAGFNTEVFLSDGLENNTDVEYEVNGNFLTGSVSLLTEKDGLYTGNLNVITSDVKRSVPVVFENSPSFNIEFDNSYYLPNSTSIVRASISKSDSNFRCDFTFNDYFENQEFNLTNQNFLEFSYEVPLNEQLDIQYDYECKNDISSLSGNGFFEVWTYEEPPFSLTVPEDTITDEPGEVIIENNWDVNLLLSLSFSKEVEDYVIDPLIELPAGTRVKTYITRIQESNLNLVENNFVVVEAKGYSERKEFEILLNENIQERKEAITEEISNNKLYFWGIVFLIISGILLGTFFYIGKISNIRIRGFNNSKENTDMPSQQKRSGVNREAPLAESLMAVDKILGQSDKDIRSDIESHGYKDDEIDEMLKELETMNKDFHKPKDKPKEEK